VLIKIDYRGIEPSVSAFEIKKAYRKAALGHHPNKVSKCVDSFTCGKNKGADLLMCLLLFNILT